MRLPLFFTLLLSVVMNLSASDTTNYTLDVQFKNIPDSVRFTLGSDDDAYKQKVSTSGNRLHFALDISENYPVRFYLIGKNPADPKNDRFLIHFYGMKGLDQIIVSNANGFSTDSIVYSGTPWDKAKMKWERYRDQNNREKTRIREESDRLSKNYLIEGSESRVKFDSIGKIRFDSLSNIIFKLQDDYFATQHDHILANPNSPDALSDLKWRYKYFTDDEIGTILPKIPEYMKGSPEEAYVNKIHSTKRIKMGDKLDNFDIVGENVDGTPIRLSQFTTPYIIVDFNSLGCGACRGAAKKELPGFVEKYGDTVTVVSYSTDESRKDMERTHEIDKATWPTIWDGSGPDGETCLKYGVTGYPTFFIFGPDRTLIDAWSGWGPNIITHKFNSAVKKYEDKDTKTVDLH
ncbi:MAG: TlpA family protein disulfide reductase [Duncaniella sp.]|uniref:TlpA family protein disulfide reductase n=1 Tax=Duncaniella sp. TaxID=2518496 RepID=UPI0023C23C24|nr:TlpA disulfide reductase family protein [Duncaniella sp.]MDE6091141.1 TlpA family protein disulfide reductase [Duncaniella sp.]